MQKYKKKKKGRDFFQHPTQNQGYVGVQEWDATCVMASVMVCSSGLREYIFG
jgi:hypothetical protein